MEVAGTSPATTREMVKWPGAAAVERSRNSHHVLCHSRAPAARPVFLHCSLLVVAGACRRLCRSWLL